MRIAERAAAGGGGEGRDGVARTVHGVDVCAGVGGADGRRREGQGIHGGHSGRGGRRSEDGGVELQAQGAVDHANIDLVPRGVGRALRPE